MFPITLTCSSYSYLLTLLVSYSLLVYFNFSFCHMVFYLYMLPFPCSISYPWKCFDVNLDQLSFDKEGTWTKQNCNRSKQTFVFYLFNPIHILSWTLFLFSVSLLLLVRMSIFALIVAVTLWRTAMFRLPDSVSVPSPLIVCTCVHQFCSILYPFCSVWEKRKKNKKK